ncbi:MAG: tetratricopeptide repeat protein [Candidatus Sumerlaeota bacterium]|nr:tetratricopeptide repeat protein [Candidatus Sumerlaeota bacterium]
MMTIEFAQMADGFFPFRRSCTLGFRGLRSSLLCFIALLIAARVPAAEIIFNNGQTRTGVILEETNTIVRLRIGDSPTIMTFVKSNIKEIRRDENVANEEHDGDLKLNLKEYPVARSLYQVALKKMANETTAVLRLTAKITQCTSEIIQGNQAKLIAAYDRAQAFMQKEGLMRIPEAIKIIDEIQPEDAAGGFEGVTAKEIGRRKALLYMKKAEKEMDTLEYVKAAASIDQAIKFAPDLGQMYFMRAEMLRKSGYQQEDAIKDYLTGLELGKDQLAAQEKAKYHFALGMMYRSRGRSEEALKHFIDVIDLAPSQFKEAAGLSGEAYLDIINSAGDDKLLENAEAKLTMLKRLIQFNPIGALSIHLRQRVADIYAKSGKAQEAIEALQGILATDASISDINYRIGRTYLILLSASESKTERQTFLKNAEERFKSELAVNPRNYEAFCDLAQLYIQTFRLTDARAILEQAIQLEEAKWRGHYYIMHVYKRLGDQETDLREKMFLDKALEQADKVLRMRTAEDPEFYDAILLQAIIKLKMRQFDEASKLLQQVLNAFEGKPVNILKPIQRHCLSSAHNYQGVIALETKDAIYVAKDEYEKAIAIDEKNADPNGNLAEVLKRLAGRPDVTASQKAEINRQTEACLKKAIELEPENPDRYQALGLLYYRDLKDLAKALPQFKEYIRLGGKSADIPKYIAEIEQNIK